MLRNWDGSSNPCTWLATLVIGIAETATQGRYELIIMGSHGHSALGNVVLGSVATRVLARCKTPVLIIR